MARIPAGAYEVYLELGTQRSYQALADRYCVSKTAIVKRAKKERWQERLAELERQARERAEEKAVDEMGAVHERHLKEARFLQARALQALRDLPPEKGLRAASMLNVAWKHELLLLGAATGRQVNEHRGGVLVAPAGMTPEEWIQSAAERSARATEPGKNGNR